MACTVAVEEVITEHYNDQLRQLAARRENDEELRTIIRQHRDDEQEHCDTGIRHDAEKVSEAAPPGGGGEDYTC